MPTKTPVKWEKKTLEYVCDFLRGLTYSKKDEVAVSSNIVLRASNIDLKTNSLNLNELKYIREDFFVPEDKKIKKNTLMICTASGSKSHLGKVALIEDECDFAFGGFMGLIKPNGNILAKFLYYKMVSYDYVQFIQNLTDGANINNLKWSDLKEFSLLLPPVDDQQRIVEILDKAFEDIEQLTANAKQNLQNAKDLFDSYLEQIFSENSKIWKEKTLNQIGIIQTGTTPKTSEKENFGDYIPFIKPADFYKDGSLNYENEGLSEIGIKKSRLIKEKSVLMVCIGATIGKTGYTEQDITCNQQINSLTPSTDYYKFLYYAMIRKSFQSIIIDGCPQTTLPIINKTNWSNLTIKLPEIDEQILIANKLDGLKEEIKQLEQIYQQKIEQAEELKQSILQKAFNGKL